MAGQKVLSAAMGVFGTLALLTAVSGLSACSTSDPTITIGKKFHFERLSAIQEGRTTKRQVKELLGEPYKKEQLAPRREKWRYYYRQESSKTFALFINMETYVTENELIIMFDGAFVDSIKKDFNQYTE